MEAHEIKFINKKRAVEPAPVGNVKPSPNTIDGLIGTDLVTEIAGESVSVKLNSIKVAHIILDEVTNWEPAGNQLIIYSEDPQPLVLTFISLPEAQSGLTRFELAMNGNTI